MPVALQLPPAVPTGRPPSQLALRSFVCCVCCRVSALLYPFVSTSTWPLASALLACTLSKPAPPLLPPRTPPPPRTKSLARIGLRVRLRKLWVWRRSGDGNAVHDDCPGRCDWIWRNSTRVESALQRRLSHLPFGTGRLWRAVAMGDKRPRVITSSTYITWTPPMEVVKTERRNGKRPLLVCLLTDTSVRLKIKQHGHVR